MSEERRPPELRDLVDIPAFLGEGLARVTSIRGTSPLGESIVWEPGFDLTLLLFLSTSCEGCRDLWAAFGAPRSPLPGSPAGVIVTRGPDVEDPELVSSLSGEAFVVMSEQAWDDYQVYSGPFFVLVDGLGGRVVTQGVALSVATVVRAVEAAIARA